jgi:hypothetical protein
MKKICIIILSALLAGCFQTTIINNYCCCCPKQSTSANDCGIYQNHTKKTETEIIVPPIKKTVTVKSKPAIVKPPKVVNQTVTKTPDSTITKKSAPVITDISIEPPPPKQPCPCDDFKPR